VRKKFGKLVKDDTPMVRRGASQALSVLSDKVATEHVSEFLLTHLE